MQLKKLHLIAGVILSAFIGLHLFNHFYSLFGVEKHIALMNSLRQVYRHIFMESILLLAVLFQVVSGVRLLRKNKARNAPFFSKMQIYTGFYLSLFLVFHVGAVLGGRFILGLDTNFYFGTAGLNTFPFNLFFIPYYGLAILAFFGHIASIHHHKMTKIIVGMTPAAQSRLILAVGVGVTAIIFYGLTNRFQGIAIPEAYQIMIGR